jgi:hypothetical protein
MECERSHQSGEDENMQKLPLRIPSGARAFERVRIRAVEFSRHAQSSRLQVIFPYMARLIPTSGPGSPANSV